MSSAAANNDIDLEKLVGPLQAMGIDLNTALVDLSAANMATVEQDAKALAARVLSTSGEAARIVASAQMRDGETRDQATARTLEALVGVDFDKLLKHAATEHGDALAAFVSGAARQLLGDQPVADMLGSVANADFFVAAAAKLGPEVGPLVQLAHKDNERFRQVLLAKALGMMRELGGAELTNSIMAQAMALQQ